MSITIRTYEETQVPLWDSITKSTCASIPMLAVNQTIYLAPAVVSYSVPKLQSTYYRQDASVHFSLPKTSERGVEVLYESLGGCVPLEPT